MTQKLWSENQVRELIKYWTSGLSSGQIAKKMDFSRSAVLGKVHRLKLQKRGQNFVYEKRNLKKKTAQPIKVALRKNLTPMTELRNNQCRFPMGNPLDVGFGFCQSDAIGGKPYCAKHQSICYEPAKSLAVKKTTA